MDKVKDPDAPAPRSVLKLKSPSARARTPEPRPPAVHTPAPPPAAQPRDPGSWADVYKRKMQADMDALGFGVEPTSTKEPRR